ncbi:MAG: ATP-binding protein [Cyanobacteria bacterium J06634_5]
MTVSKAPSLTDAIVAPSKKKSPFKETDKKAGPRRWLVKVAIGSSVAIAAAATFGCYWVVRSLTLEILKSNAFLEVQQGVNEIDQWLVASKAEVETVANAPTVRSMELSQIDSYVQRLIAGQSNFFKYAMGFTNGRYYSSARRNLAENSIGDRIYFQQALLGHTFVSDPIISRTTGIPQVNIAAPIWPISNIPASLPTSEASPTGVFIGSVAVNRVTTVVNQLQYGRGSYPFALNSRGQAIVHPNTRLMSTKEKPAPSFLDASDANLAALAQSMGDQEQDIELISIDGEIQYVAYLPLQEANWSIALVIPRENIEGQLRPLNLIAFGGLALTLAMLTVLWRVKAFEKKQLQRTKIAAELANKAKSEFLTNMTHELRTPLNGILGYAQILQREQAMTTQQKKGLNIIHQSGQYLLLLINDVLDLAKIEARKLELTLSPVLLAPLLLNIVEIIRVQANQKELELIYQPSPHLPKVVAVDEKRLQQILMNLLGNAVKFTDRGSITLTVEVLQHPDNAFPPESCSLSFSIQDTGVGISPETLPHIFSPFEQDKDLQYHKEGAGLGLAISQQIAHLMNTDIHVQSCVDKGSTFSFTLNLLVLKHSESSLSKNIAQEAYR